MSFDKRIVVVAIVLMFAGFIAFSQVSYAMDPPTKQQINSYKKDGTYDARLANATHLKNNQFDPVLVEKFNKKHGIKTSSTQSSKTNSVGSSSSSSSTSNSNLPTNWKGGLPSTGNVKVPVILIDFPDYPHNVNDTVTKTDSKFFGSGNPDNYPYESLKNYYLRSSYGKLNITGTVYGWYTAAHVRSYYSNLSSSGDFSYGNEALIMEAVNYFHSQGVNFSQYDNDNNGYIDSLYVKWTGPDNGWANFWWAYQSNWQANSAFTVDGKKFNKFVWSWYNNSAQGSPSDSIRTDIHETGHLLGLPDYYDYNTDTGPDGGVGGLDMMDSNWGDHNCFSKYILGWINPQIINSGTWKVVLNPSGTSTDSLIIMPGTLINPYQEYFMVQFRKRGAGNDPLNYHGTDSKVGWPGDYPNDGILIWHIDATLNSSGTDYLYDNSYTSHKLLSLLEADGLSEIESGKSADAGDYYVPGSVLNPYSDPNSYNYSSSDTGVVVDNIAYSGSTIFGRFGIIAKSSGSSLKESVDSDLNWTTGGDQNGGKSTGWISETGITHDGSDSAQSGFINDNQMTWIQTTVTGPGTISFWWKVSSEFDKDKLGFYVDAINQTSLSGLVDWNQFSCKIGNGVHTLTWAYVKDGSGFDGNDTAWLDNVKWVLDDITPPTASSNTVGGIYNKVQSIVLSMNEAGTIYYTLNGTTPTLSSIQYTQPIEITNTTTLKYMAIDLAGNPSGIYTQVYTLDFISPKAFVDPKGGLYNSKQEVNLNMDETGTIYYSINGSSPNMSMPYTQTITISSDTVLKFFALDLAGNVSPVYTETYYIDVKPPEAYLNQAGGVYNNTKNVTLSMNEAGNIYYTLNGATPTTTSTQYTQPIEITNNSTLKYMAVDLAGNPSIIYSQKFIFDTTSPYLNVKPSGGIYNINKIVAINMNENGTIYYTLNGTLPSTKSYQYKGPITISKNTVLKYFGVDLAGNSSPFYTQNYTINRNVLRVTHTKPVNMQKGFSRTAALKIQFSEAIISYIHFKSIRVKNIYTGAYSTIKTSINGNTLSVQMNHRKIKTWYVLTIPAKAVKDRVGNFLLAKYTLKFKIR